MSVRPRAKNCGTISHFLIEFSTEIAARSLTQQNLHFSNNKDIGDGWNYTNVPERGLLNHYYARYFFVSLWVLVTFFSSFTLCTSLHSFALFRCVQKIFPWWMGWSISLAMERSESSANFLKSVCNLNESHFLLLEWKMRSESESKTGTR